MQALAAARPGFLGADSARGADGLGITVSYWRDAAAATAFRGLAEHREVQRLGRERWYRDYRVRVARVERDYGRRRERPVAAQARLGGPLLPEGVRAVDGGPSRAAGR